MVGDGTEPIGQGEVEQEPVAPVSAEQIPEPSPAATEVRPPVANLASPEAQQPSDEKEPEFSPEEKRAIDMAWQTEGLDKKMKAQGDLNALSLQMAQMTVLLMQPGRMTAEMIQSSYDDMAKFAEQYSYDSGRRRFESQGGTAG